MTSASELFHNRRYRFGRNSDSIDFTSDLASPPLISRHYRHHNSHPRRDRLDPDVCEPPVRRGVHHLRQPPHHRPPSNSSHERESGRLEQGGQQFGSGNVSHSGSHSNVRGRSRLGGNDRLPGAVLLARERLLQRLGSVTLSGSRRSNMSSSINHHNSNVTNDDFRFVDATDWETVLYSEWLAAMPPLTDSVDQNVTKRPPGLTQEALNCLPLEIFHEPNDGDQHNNTPRALRECSICLESFLEGDELVRLPCGHRYHFCCLDPWVRTCGDCPYCRSGIHVVSNVGN